MNFFELTRRYPPTVIRTVNHLLREERRLSATDSHILFLDTCIFNQVPPKSFRVRPPFPSPAATHLAHKTALEYTKLRRDDLLHQKRSITLKIRSLWMQIYAVVDTTDFPGILGIAERASKTIRDQLQRKHTRKLSLMGLTLRVSTVHTDRPLAMPGAVVNLTSIHLPNEVLNTLNKGLKYSLPPPRNWVPSMVGAVEAGIRRLPPELASMLRTRCASALHSFKAPHHRQDRDTKACLTFIKDNNLTVTPADKGGSSVVLTTDDYVTKVSMFLEENVTTFQPLKKNPIPTLLREYLTIIRNGATRRALGDRTYKRLYPHSTQPPRLAGYIKTHKGQAYPIRPVVDTRNSFSCELNGFLNTILRKLTGPHTYSIKGSEHFLQTLRMQPVPEGYRMCSLDVKSLFTSVPRERCMNILRMNLETNNDWRTTTKLPIDSVLELTTYALKASVFVFNKNWYNQVEGLAMGTPLSGTLAEIFMMHVDNLLMDNSPIDVAFYCRYVDDTFLLIPEGEHDMLLTFANSLDQAIQFTIEVENNATIPFLDVLVKRGTTWDTSIYRKDCYSFLTIPFESYQPLQHKMTAVAALYRRVYTHVSEPKNRDREIQTLQKQFTALGYPQYLLRQTHRRVHKQLKYGHKRHQKKDKPYIVLPYVKGIAEDIARILGKVAHITFKPITKLKTKICSIKDSVPLTQRTGCVYSFQCGTCQAVYIGQSGRPLQDRIKEHQRYFKNREVQRSPMLQHCMDYDHVPPDFTSTKVLDMEPNYIKRTIIEGFHIQNTSNVVNKDDGTLPTAYKNIC